eukprot:SAG31_NODE_300_length_18109_cov_47.887285_2_plen_56_part_00
MKSPADTYLGVDDPEIGTCTDLPESTYDIMAPTWPRHGSDMAPTWFRHGPDMAPT